MQALAQAAHRAGAGNGLFTIAPLALAPFRPKSRGWSRLHQKEKTLIKTRHFAALAVTFVALAAAGCQKEPESAAVGPGECKREAAEALVGKDRISDAQAMSLTGATIVRQIKPGDGVTMDLRQERVTIETDPATGKITRAMCG